MDEIVDFCETWGFEAYVYNIRMLSDHVNGLM